MQKNPNDSRLKEGSVQSQLFVQAYCLESKDRLAKIITNAKAKELLAPVTVIVPSIYSSLSLRRTLDKDHGLINVGFMALPRLSEYLGAPAMAAQGKSPLSTTMKLLAIRHFSREMSSKEPLGAIADHAQMHNYLVGTFDELSMLSEAGLSTLENKSPVLKQILEWYRLYRGFISRYYDTEELTRVAAISLLTGEALIALHDLGFIIFYLVARFSPAEIELVKILGINRRCAVILGLTGDKEVDIETNLTAERLEPALGKIKLEIPVRYIGASHISITPDAHEEVRSVLRHIAKNAENGIPFHKMAILFRNADPYATLIKNQFELAGIPMAGPNVQFLRDTPLGKLLIYLLDIFSSGFSRESVMRWVSEAPLQFEKNQKLTSREVGLWEIVSSKAGIIKGKQQWTERLDNFSKGMQEKTERCPVDENGEPIGIEYFKTQKAAAVSLKSLIIDLIENDPKSNDKWENYADWCKKMIHKYAIHHWPQEEQEGFDKIMAKLDELRELQTMEPVGTDLARFRQMLDDCLKTTAGKIGQIGSGVFVAPINSAQGMEFDTVYIVGMSEAAFPPPLPDDAIITEKYRTELGGGGSLPLRAARRIDERRIFKAAMSTGQKCFLSYPRSGNAGQKHSYPSPWLVKEAENLRCEGIKDKLNDKKEITSVSSTNLENLVGEPWLTTLHSVQHGFETLGGLEPFDLHDYDMHSLARWQMSGSKIDRHFLMLQGCNQRTLKLERGRKGETLTIWDGNVTELTGKSAKLGIPRDSNFSPTRLEIWAKCPFQYFMRHVLEIAILDRPEDIITISALDRGTLVHTILERFMKSVIGGTDEPGIAEPWTEKHSNLLNEIAGEEFNKIEEQGITGKPLLWKVAQKEILEDLSGFLEQDNKLRAEGICKPIEIECEFGFGGISSYPPVILTTGGGHQIRFRGKIDRIDSNASKSKLKVFDYKTGSTYAYSDMRKNSLLGGGKHLQLPVYAIAVRKRFGDKCDIEASYWFITARSNFLVKTVALSEVETEFNRLVEVITSYVNRGIFPANPGKGGANHNNCVYCDYERVCPSNRELVWEKKSWDPLLAEYIDMGKEETSDEEEV